MSNHETRKLKLPVVAADQSQKHIPVNESFNILDDLTHITVANNTQSSPPDISPLEGTGYILAAGNLTGLFEGHQNDIAVWRDSRWQFYTPAIGWLVWVQSANELWIFTQGWGPVSEQSADFLASLPDAIARELTDASHSCQVQGVDEVPSDSNISFSISLTCIGNTPSEGTGLLDGVITINSDTNFTWDGMAFDGLATPQNLVATRMPNDGANNAMTQKWLVKGAVFDFALLGQIFINNAIGATNLTGSFEGEVFYGTRGSGVVPVNTLIAAYLAEHGGIAAATTWTNRMEWDSTVSYAIDDVVRLPGKGTYLCIRNHTNANPATATATWQPIALDGTNGTNGINGTNGKNAELSEDQTANLAKIPEIEADVEKLKTDGTGGGLSEKAVDERIDAKLTPALFESNSGTIPAVRPGTSFVVRRDNSPFRATPLVVQTSGLSGIDDGEIIKLDSSMAFDGEFTGSAPLCGIIISQDGQPIYTNMNLPAQGAGPISFYGRKGPDLSIQPVFTVNNELSATLYPYTYSFAVKQLGKFHNITVQLIQTQIAIALTEVKLMVAQNTQGVLENQTHINTLQMSLSVLKNAFDALTERLNNDTLNFILSGSVIDAGQTRTQKRTALGDTWGAIVETGNTPWTERLLVGLRQGSVKYNQAALGGSTDEKTVLAYENNGFLYGRLYTPAINHPLERTTHFTTVGTSAQINSGNRHRIDLGVNNVFTASTTSFVPESPIPAGTTVNVDLHAYVNSLGREIVEIEYVWGSGVPVVHEVDHEGDVSIIATVDEFHGNIRVRITQATGENNLAVDDGYVLGYVHWDTERAAYTSPERVDDTQLMRHTGVSVMALVRENGKLVIYYGNGGRFETNQSVQSQIDYYIVRASREADGSGGLMDLYTISSQENYDVSGIQANADAAIDYFGLFIDVPHQTEKAVFPGGLVLTDPEEKQVDVLEVLADLMKGGEVPGKYIKDCLTQTVVVLGAEVQSITMVYPPNSHIWGLGGIVLEELNSDIDINSGNNLRLKKSVGSENLALLDDRATTSSTGETVSRTVIVPAGTGKIEVIGYFTQLSLPSEIPRAME